MVGNPVHSALVKYIFMMIGGGFGGCFNKMIWNTNQYNFTDNKNDEKISWLVFFNHYPYFTDPYVPPPEVLIGNLNVPANASL